MRNNWSNILKWFLLIIYLILIIRIIAGKKQSEICYEYYVSINGAHEFINKEIVDKLLITNNIILDSININSINFEKIEKIIGSHPAVLNAEVFNDYSGNIFINIKQRKPILRVITKENTSFYIDSEGEMFPFEDYYTAHAPVLSGNVSNKILNNPADDYELSLSDIYDLIVYLNEHDLWKYQIAQIFVNQDKELELIPLLGDYIINLGGAANFQYKLSKLEAFYKTTFESINWYLYSEVDLRYSDQVILKKR